MSKKYSTLLLVLIVLCFTTSCGKTDEMISTEENTEILETTTEESKIITTEEILAYNNFDVDDLVTLNVTKDFEVTLSDEYDVTNEDIVIDYLNNYLATQTVVTYNVLDKTTVENNDAVNIDYIGYINDEPFDNGTAKDIDLVIGSNTYIDGFETQIIGHNVGETFDIFVTFPENFGVEELNGQEAKFTITLNAIEEAIESDTVLTYDTMSNDEAKQYFGLETKEEVLESLSDYLNSSADDMLYNAKQEALYELLLKESTFTLDDNLTNEYIEHSVELQNNMITNLFGMTLDTYVETFQEGMTTDEYISTFKDNAKESYKFKLVLDSLIKSNNYTITEEDFNSYMTSYVSYYGYSSVDEVYKNYASKEEMILLYAESKYYDEIINNLDVNFEKN